MLTLNLFFGLILGLTLCLAILLGAAVGGLIKKVEALTISVMRILDAQSKAIDAIQVVSKEVDTLKGSTVWKQ